MSLGADPPVAQSFVDQASQLSADKAVLRATHDGSTAGQLANSSAAVLDGSMVVSFGDTMLYKSWAEVPDQPPVSLQPRSVFLEVFSGKAWLTRAMRKQGWLALPPIDIVVDGDVLEPRGPSLVNLRVHDCNLQIYNLRL